VIFLCLIVSIFAREKNELIFLSDTQRPIWVETILLPPYRNEEATDSLFSDIVREKPKALFLLGDLVSVGSDVLLWREIDDNLNQLRKKHIKTYAVPGNHEYMFVASFGIHNYNMRFPYSKINGYVKIIDSIAVILLNSNFGYLKLIERKEQQEFLEHTLMALDTNDAVQSVIVTCHHAPFTNSTIVKADEDVRQNFVKLFLKSTKTKIFMTGHSHNLEMFKHKDKTFLVIGGGGGLKQPLCKKEYRKWRDALDDNIKPLYFYIIVKRKAGKLIVTARGFKKDFKFFDLKLLEINQ
jgi:UDP-2,3-diacylglucosamine pyrophosphatase LpxH